MKDNESSIDLMKKAENAKTCDLCSYFETQFCSLGKSGHEACSEYEMIKETLKPL
jgi:SET domain-containing protein